MVNFAQKIMKKIILLIAAIIDTALATGCVGTPDYMATSEEFMIASAPYEGTRIMHISDVHGDFNRLNAILKVAEKCSDFVINTGDDVNGHPGQSFSDIAEDFLRYRETVNRCRLTVLGVQGNHDAFCTRCEYREAMVNHIPELITGNDTGAYGYYDRDDLRVILLDPRDSDDDNLDWWAATFSQPQIDWLVKTLEDARQKGLGVITVMHYAFGDNPQHSHENVRPDINYYQNPFIIPAIINAIKTGQGMMATFYPQHEGGEQITVDIQPSGLQLDYIVHLFGHLHSKEAYQCAKVDGSREYGMLMLGEASLSRKGDALDLTDREGDDGIAASLLVVDRQNRMIHRISYGAFVGARCNSFSY